MLTSTQVIETFVQLITSVRHWGWMMNERYFHHLFSSRLQAQGISSDITNLNSLLQLHPEWPTCKKKTGLCYAWYRYNDGKYFCKRDGSDGSAGFVDFAIGDYQKPEIGIEFCIKHSWHNEEVIYDFLKLMDARNPFSVGLSYTAIIREKNVSRGKDLSRLVVSMNKALTVARARLEERDYQISGRQLLFVISELGLDTIRYWYFDNSITSFKEVKDHFLANDVKERLTREVQKIS